MILDQIIADKRAELATTKRLVPLAEVQRMASEQAEPVDFAAALKGNVIRLIAEIKKASPSRGVIRPDMNPVEIAEIYAANGASAISVLTEVKYFQGSLNHLRDTKKRLGDKMPLLRKDFIWEPYQIYESRAYGADALLLIVAILDVKKLKELLWLSHGLGMNCLVEVHNETEVEVALKGEAKIIGVNNRELGTFGVDLTTTQRLLPLIPPGKIVVSESGIKNRNDMKKSAEWGVDAVLVGESLISATNIAKKMKELL